MRNGGAEGLDRVTDLGVVSGIVQGVAVSGGILEPEARLGAQATVVTDDVDLSGVAKTGALPVLAGGRDLGQDAVGHLDGEGAHDPALVTYGGSHEEHGLVSGGDVRLDVDEDGFVDSGRTEPVEDGAGQRTVSVRTHGQVGAEVDVLVHRVHHTRRGRIDEEAVAEPERPELCPQKGMVLGMSGAVLRAIAGVDEVGPDLERILADVGGLEVLGPFGDGEQLVDGRRIESGRDGSRDAFLVQRSELGHLSLGRRDVQHGIARPRGRSRLRGHPARPPA